MESARARRFLLLVTGIVGIALIIVAVFLPDSKCWHIVASIAEGIGIALLTSAVLGFTIEGWLRSDLSKDVFLTAIGHHLPEPYRTALRSELIRLSGYKFICDKHVLKIQIERIDDNCVRVVAFTERTLTNISTSSQEIGGYIHVDEWQFAQGKSSITECRIELVDDNSVPAIEDFGATDHPNLSIRAENKQQLRIKPGGSVRFSARSCEYKRPTDDLSFVFGTPTHNPTIEVDVPTGSKFQVTFGPDEEKTVQERASTRRTLQGVYWPLQRMRVQWWRDP